MVCVTQTIFSLTLHETVRQSIHIRSAYKQSQKGYLKARATINVFSC